MSRPFRIVILILIGFSKIAASENYPGGARAIGLSNAFVSATDTWSTFHNQATISNIKNFSAGLFFESKYCIEELSLSAGTLILPVRGNTIGINFYQMGKGTCKEQKLGVAFSKKLSKKLNAAIQLDYFSKRYPENRKALNFVTFECGATYHASNHITLGAHLFNPVNNGFDTPLGKQKMPVILRLGGHYSFHNTILLAFETQKNSNYDAIVKTGLEFLPLKNLAMRIGVSGRPIKLAAGLGYSFRNISTDIAFSYHGNLGATPSVSIQFNL